MLATRAAIVAGLLVLGGCAESTVIRTHPPGASLWINDTYLGQTPVEYGCSRDAFGGPHHYRLELAGYRTAEGELRKHVMAGRIVAADLTLGLSLIFKRPTGFRDRYDFALVPELRPLASAVPAPSASAADR
jgi:hypothetical protein